MLYRAEPKVRNRSIIAISPGSEPDGGNGVKADLIRPKAVELHQFHLCLFGRRNVREVE